ncbi:hypothetical protein RKE29_05970 [Streptomyces sp. B1866]|uniref:hypothetical protein n=1 Tax=Streptomyces sp. B1866 TaxID=3075431 RepID=UPI002890A9A7|nr:hypothetical protein [Streptomyces sp. B1866]MDT3396187.1 hypothetical protein [Streptomyces sp. B1866]
MRRIEVLDVSARTVRVKDVVLIGGWQHTVVNLISHRKGKKLVLESGQTYLLEEGESLPARRITGR